jgi:AcrR family transcriptional regulator
MTTMTKQKRRLSQNDWLARAMDVLSREGAARLNIDSLCESLGVTKGSFYAHFEDRADFVAQLVAYWRDNITQNVIDAIDDMEDATAADRLLALMQFLHQTRSARHDAAVRAWAAREPEVARAVQKVDKLRFDYLRQIFHDMGFRGAELDLRSRLFVVYHGMDQGMQLPASGLKADKEIKLRHAFFTRA